MATDWHTWHRSYDDESSPLTRRLEVVQDEVATCLERRPPGRIRVLSLCAGDGRDLLGVLSRHPRAHDVDALLIDLDQQLMARARRAAGGLGLRHVRCVVGDAGHARTYEDHCPVDLVLVCGVFGK